MTDCTCNSFSSSTGTPALTVSQTGTAIGLTVTSTCGSQNAMTISTNTDNSSGLWSNCSGNGTGIAGSCNGANGGMGMQGNDHSLGGGIGVYATSDNGRALMAESTTSYPVATFLQRSTGISTCLYLSGGTTTLSVSGHSDLSGTVVIEQNANFYSTAYVTGYLTKAGGRYLVDHPSDPSNKLLNHCFVESPDMMNIYRGSVVLDATGSATVSLPSYFSAANSDGLPGLTAMGRSMPGRYRAAPLRLAEEWRVEKWHGRSLPFVLTSGRWQIIRERKLTRDRRRASLCILSCLERAKKIDWTQARFCSRSNQERQMQQSPLLFLGGGLFCLPEFYWSRFLRACSCNFRYMAL